MRITSRWNPSDSRAASECSFRRDHVLHFLGIFNHQATDGIKTVEQEVRIDLRFQSAQLRCVHGSLHVGLPLLLNPSLCDSRVNHGPYERTDVHFHTRELPQRGSSGRIAAGSSNDSAGSGGECAQAWHRKGGDVKIHAATHDGALVLEVENSGELSPARPARDGDTQIGINNIRERLRLLYGDRASLSLKNGDGVVAATVRIPMTA